MWQCRPSASVIIDNAKGMDPMEGVSLTNARNRMFDIAAARFGNDGDIWKNQAIERFIKTFLCSFHEQELSALPENVFFKIIIDLGV